MKFSEFRKKKWFKIVSNTYVLILILFLVWMIFFDTNSLLIHKELNDDREGLQENIEFYKNKIEADKSFLKKMEDSNEVEKYARENYYLKRENEDIFIIEHEDSLKSKASND